MTATDGPQPTTMVVDKRDRVATITLNRPERLNALNETLRGELMAALDQIGDDDQVHVVILRGAGRAFSAGNDIHDVGVLGSGRERHPGDTSEDWSRAQGHLKVFWKLWDLPKPVIAQVHGFSLGMASMLLVACDLVVVAEDARIGNALSIMGAGMMGPRYLWSMGMRRGKWLDMLPGWRITGKEAVDWGFANMAVPADRLEEEVRALAEQIAVAPLAQLKFRKTSLNRVWEERGFRYSVSAGIDFDPLAHQSEAGIEMENQVGARGFVNLGSELYAKFPRRHGHH